MKLRNAMGEVTRNIRLGKGLTMREVTERAGMSLSHLSDIENGRKEASSEIWECVANGLGVSLATIVLEAGHLMSPIPDTADAFLDRFGRDFTRTARF